MFRFGMGELVVILLIILILFGAKKLPEVGKGMGEAFRGFRDAIKSQDDDVTTTASKEPHG